MKTVVSVIDKTTGQKILTSIQTNQVVIPNVGDIIMVEDKYEIEERRFALETDLVMVVLIARKL